MRHIGVLISGAVICGIGFFAIHGHLYSRNQNANNSKTTVINPYLSSSSRGPASAPQEYCLLCQFPTPKNKNTSNLMCEDLYKAACDSPAKKTPVTKEQEEKDAKNPLEEKRDLAAKQMGYANFDDGLKKRLKEAGLELHSDLDEEDWDHFVSNLYLPANEEEEKPSPTQNPEDGPPPSSDVFKGGYYCEPQYTPAQKLSPAALKKTATDLKSKFTQRNQQIQTQVTKLYAKSLPTYLEGYLFPKCTALKYGELDPKLNPELAKVCEQSNDIRREAILLYREEGTPEYQKKAEEFIRRTWVPEPISRSKMAFGLPLASTTPAKQNVIQEIDDLNNQIYNQCINQKQAMMTAARSVGLDYVTQINRSRFVVEGAISNTYTDTRKKQLDQIYEVVRSDVQALVPQLTTDKNKQARIIDEYNRVNLFWMEKPKASDYTRNAEGLEVLDPTKGGGKQETSLNSIFNDPSLSFFSNGNAYYTPETSYGKQKESSHIQVMPGFLNLLEENPYGLVSIIAHEAGHKIGPEISKISDHDMNTEYKDLLACYKDRKSIRMQDNQSDETIADYVSSEVMAYHISKLPQENRRSALVAVASTFCSDGPHMPIRCKEVHPEGMMRVNGIIGANPNLRKMMGCNEESSQFKSCGLKDVSLLSKIEDNKDSSLIKKDSLKDKHTEGVE